MIIQKVLTTAEPYLAGRTVKDVVIGLALVACELDNGAVGVSYVLREGLARGCSRFQKIQNLIGKPALEAAELVLNGGDNIQRAVAVSVLTAAAQQLEIPPDDGDTPFGLTIQPEDRVAMIGHIVSIAKQVSMMTDDLIVFDKGLAGDGLNSFLAPIEKQAELLPTCDIVLISGTATINKSIDSLLEMCTNAREVVIMGPSTPMFAEGFRDSCVTRLAGSFWANEHKDDIFKIISLAGGIGSIEKYMIKKLVKIK